jgi:DnaA-homolog protein
MSMPTLVEAGLGPQLPLSLRALPDQRLDAYVGMPDGLGLQLQQLANTSQREAVYLHGASSTGKTHLLLASCAEAEHRGREASYRSLRGLQGKVQMATDGLAAPVLLALDDVDAVIGHRDDEVALFHLHNRVMDAGGCILYAAQYAPDALPCVLPDLRSRLMQCTRWVLPVLDDAGRAKLLRMRAQARGLVFEDAAVEWVLRRYARDLGSLVALFDVLDRASMAAQRRLTIPFLRLVLGET